MKLINSVGREIKEGSKVAICFNNGLNKEYTITFVTTCRGEYMDELTGEMRHGLYFMDEEGICVDAFLMSEVKGVGLEVVCDKGE